MPLSEQTLQFLIENKIENSRDWFNAHKEDYRRLVVQPLADFVTALTPTMLKIDPLFDCTPKINRTISRVYRDTRFSKDKSLFRDVAWCVFNRDKKLFYGLPGFFFEFSPRGFRYGCGFYCTDTATMANLRQLILENDPVFKEAKSAFEKQNIFALTGDRYKKSHYPDQPEELRLWLELKDICFIRYSTDFELLYSDTLPQTVAEDLKLLALEYQLMLNAAIAGNGL